jgi:hypothetical protein
MKTRRRSLKLPQNENFDEQMSSSEFLKVFRQLLERVPPDMVFPPIYGWKATGELLFCQAKKQTKTVGPGNWFFHTGSWMTCGEAYQDQRGRWGLNIAYAPLGKELPASIEAFGSLDEALAFMSEFFEVPVRRVRPSQLPKPEDL